MSNSHESCIMEEGSDLGVVGTQETIDALHIAGQTEKYTRFIHASRALDGRARLPRTEKSSGAWVAFSRSQSLLREGLR